MTTIIIVKSNRPLSIVHHCVRRENQFIPRVFFLKIEAFWEVKSHLIINNYFKIFTKKKKKHRAGKTNEQQLKQVKFI